MYDIDENYCIEYFQDKIIEIFCIADDFCKEYAQEVVQR